MSGIRRKIFRFGVDFDLTLVDSLWPWIVWFNSYLNKMALLHPQDYGSQLKAATITEDCYLNFTGEQLADLMNERQAYLHPLHRVNALSYWRQADLYDNMTPLKYSREFFTGMKHHMSIRGFDVEYVCVTKCEPEHEHSKRRFISSHFGDLFSGFVSTDDKHLVKMDCLIDDNPKYVKPCNENDIFQIYVPQGHVRTFDHVEDFCEEYLTIPRMPGYVNHFACLLEMEGALADMLIRHYNYVR